MTIAFLVSMFGFVIVIRISRVFVDRNLLSKNEMTKIGTVHFIMFAVMIAIAPRTLFALWGAVFAPITLTSIAMITLVNRRSREFRNHFRETLTLIVLKMKAGESFRQSLSEVVDESHSHHRDKLGEISNLVAFSQQNIDMSDDSFVREVVTEFSRVDSSPHSAIRRLSVFRDKLRIEDEFRHKSGQVLAQIRAQSFVMSGLYVAVFVFVVHRFGWKGNADIFIASLTLFLIGAAWIWFGGRRMKWRV